MSLAFSFLPGISSASPRSASIPPSAPDRDHINTVKETTPALERRYHSQGPPKGDCERSDRGPPRPTSLPSLPAPRHLPQRPRCARGWRGLEADLVSSSTLTAVGTVTSIEPLALHVPRRAALHMGARASVTPKCRKRRSAQLRDGHTLNTHPVLCATPPRPPQAAPSSLRTLASAEGRWPRARSREDVAATNRVMCFSSWRYLGSNQQG